MSETHGGGTRRRVSLHEHLDGSLSPQTLIELSRAGGTRLPASDPEGISRFIRGSVAGSLERYLSCFELTVAALQTEEALERAAYEHAAQLSADGCDRGEIRFAPQLHAPGNTNSIRAVLHGLGRARGEGLCDTGLIVCAMRESDPATVLEVARAAADEPGCVGFDLAGMETGNPPQLHMRALAAVRESGMGLTIHAGESEGPQSIAAALDAGARRIGHGVRIMEDIHLDGSTQVLGEVARRVLEGRIHLEVCVSSNLDTGVYPGAGAHPVMALKRLGFSVSLSTDNRLMSGTTLEREEHLCAMHLDAGVAELDDMVRAGRDALFAVRN